MSDLGSNVIPFQGGGMPMAPPQPPMQINPAFLQWMQLKQARDVEEQKRQGEFLAACELIREDVCKSYRIDIEADSTVAADEEAGKRSRTEFLQAIVPFMQIIIPQITENPALRPLGAEMLKFAFHAFPASRQLEDALDQALQQMINMPAVPGKGDQGKKTLEETQMETALGHEQIKGDLAQAQIKAQSQQQSDAAKIIAAQTGAQAAREKAQADAQLKRVELALRGREMQGREALDAARLTRIGIRNTQDLI